MRDIHHDSTKHDILNLALTNVEYQFHGIGCLLIFSDREVDFDFGPENRTDGFDLWRLTEYTLSCPEKYPEYKDKDKLKQDFENAVQQEMITKLDNPYCNLYFKKKRV